MTLSTHKTVILWAASASVLLVAAAAEATVGPPVKISMAGDTRAAASGQLYAGVFEVDVAQAGILSGFRLEGEGWTVLSLDHPLDGNRAETGLIRIPFRAEPADADQEISLSLRYNGQRITRGFKIGPTKFAQRGRSHAAGPAGGVRGEDACGAARAGRLERDPSAVATPTPEHEDSGVARGATSLQVKGRIVYQRPDGLWVGVDHVWVQVKDDDDVVEDLDDTIWEGYTDETGWFDTGTRSIDDPDGPDVYLRWECDTDIVNVQDGDDITEPDWSWSTEDTGLYYEDFGGGVLDFGDVTSCDSALMPPMHIHNSIIRAHRFVLDRSGSDLPEFDVVWPEGSNASYICFYEQMEVSPAREWNEDTHVHEFGHHFECTVANPNSITEYCNGTCDTAETCGHCMWCDENEEDAWHEGFPHWLADVVTRSFETDYVNLDGTPYSPMFLRDAETPQPCDCTCSGCSCPYPQPPPGVFTTPLRTEGFVHALLRDMEDADQDDHDGDGIADCMAVGPGAILLAVNVIEPETVAEFINGFRNLHPSLADDFYKTALNVDASFVDTFPPDTAAPAAVTADSVTSPTHPLGNGGRLPCVTVQWGPPEDDVTGARAYSYIWSTSPSPGEEPDFIDDVPDTCAGWAPSPPLMPGEQIYLRIRARDAIDQWGASSDWFGPFVMTTDECALHDNDIPDVCDAYCNLSDAPIACQDPILIDYCGAFTSCGTEPDCNTNAVPDDCDILEGTSEDCNRDGTPDECQTAIIKHFTGANTDTFGVAQWELTENWEEGALPVDGDHVCIPLGTPATKVSFSEDVRRLTTLNCDTDFSIDGSSPELRIDEPSYVSGELTLAVTSTLRAMTSLDVGGELDWRGLEILGPGTVNVFGGFDLSSPVALPKLRSSAHLSILDGDVNIHGDEYLELYDTSTFSIGLPVTYTYDGNFNIFAGAPTTIVNVHGSVIRNSGTLNATIGSFVLNSGLIHNRTGDLTLSYGGTHGGDVLGDPGTLLRLNGAHDFLATSSLVGDDVTFGGAGTSFVRGGVNIADALVISGPTCTFTSDADVTSYGQRLTVLAGSARLESPVTGASVTIDAVTIGDLTTEGSKEARFNTGQPVSFNTLNLVKGDIHGADPITINDSFVWGTGGGQIVAGGAITCNAPATIQGASSSRSLNRAFNNAAYATFLGAFGGSGPFNNLATGTVELKGNSTGIAAGTTTNAGLIVKTQGTGSASSLSGLNNSGQVRAEVGEISFSSGGTNSGTILGLPGTLLSFINGTHEMTPASSLTADDIRFANFTANIRGDVDIADTLTMDAGTCTFTNEANVTSYAQHVNIRAGSARFEAPTTAPGFTFDTFIIGDLAAEGGKDARFNTGQPVSINTLNLVKGDIYGADPITINSSFVWGTGGGQIAAGGAITCSGPATFQGGASSRNLFRVFNNAGDATFLQGFTVGSGGKFNNLTTGTMDIRSTGTVLGGSTPTLQNDGVLLKSAGNGVSTIGNKLLNTGIVEVQIGTLEFTGGASQSHIQTAGETILNGGSLSVTAGTPYQVLGGDLTGAGAITAAVQNSGGTVKPGLSAGQINITGNYTQGAGAALEIELGGPVSGVSHDRLAVSGTASLAGTLHVGLIGGYIPAIGEQFVILTAGSRTGTFAAVEPLTPGLEVDVVYGPTTVTVEVISFSTAGDCDFDGDADLDDYGLFPDCMSGPEMPHSGPQCDCIDFNGDADIDLEDFAEFQVSFTG